MTDISAPTLAARSEGARHPKRTGATGAHHRRLAARGLILVALAFVLVATPFAVVLLGERPAARSLLWDLSMGLGFGGLSLAALQFVLSARIRWITHPFGADIVIQFHRYLSHGAVLLMLAHFLILYVRYHDDLPALNPIEAPWPATAGRAALLCFLGLIVTSELRRRLRLRYEAWRHLHLGLALLGFAAAMAHALGAGAFTAQADKRLLWLGVVLGWLLLMAWSRVGRQAAMRCNPWRVVANRPRHGGVHTLELAPQGEALRDWRPGQFAWLSFDPSPFTLREHPFTISTAPERGPNLDFSIKPLGDDTAGFVKAEPGTRVWVDGPYGAFSIDRVPEADGFVMVAGGVGITPIIANLHALEARGDRRPVILLYGNATWDDAAFRDELDGMAQTMPLTVVHVLDRPPDGWPGESGRIDRDLLERHLPPESRGWPHFLCGPAPMTAAVRTALRAMGVRGADIKSEVFEMV